MSLLSVVASMLMELVSLMVSAPGMEREGKGVKNTVGRRQWEWRAMAFEATRNLKRRQATVETSSYLVTSCAFEKRLGQDKHKLDSSSSLKSGLLQAGTNNP